jgi:hypothetical protein
MFKVLEGGILDIGIEGDRLETVQTMILVFVVWAECFNLFNSLSMKESLLNQVREKSMLLPLMMAAIPIVALSYIMYIGDMGAGIDLVRLTPLQYAISVGCGTLIIPMVEVYKTYFRKAVEKEDHLSIALSRGLKVGVDGVNLLNDIPFKIQRQIAAIGDAVDLDFKRDGHKDVKRKGDRQERRNRKR